IAANSLVDRAEPHVPLRRISAIRARATEGRPLLVRPSATARPLPEAPEGPALSTRYRAGQGALRVSDPGRPTPHCACGLFPAPARHLPWSGRAPACPWPGSCPRALRCGAGCSTTSAVRCPWTLDSQNMATMLQPGRVSPLRPVPTQIPRPEYV